MTEHAVMDPSLQPPSIAMGMMAPPDETGAMVSGTADGNGNGGEDGAFNLPARNVVACSNCRSQKIKCFPAESQDKPCRRCDKYELSCQYLQHRRGRKKKLKPEDMSADSVTGSPASVTKQEPPVISYHPPIMPKDFAQPQFQEDVLRPSVPQRQDMPRNSYREGGMPGGAGYGSGYSTLMENRYMPTMNPAPFDPSFPRLHPLHGIPGYPSLAPNSGSHVSTPISADRQTANEPGLERAYSTPFALPGLTTSVAEGQMPPHMQQIASSSQSLLQLPAHAASQMPLRDPQHSQSSHGNGAYGGRIPPTVSLLNDSTATATGSGSTSRMSPRDPAPPAGSPATSSGPPRATAGEASSTSNGSNSHTQMRGSTPPIRPIEITRFPFLSPAIGEGALSSSSSGGRNRSGLTPASLPNILNMTSSTSAATDHRKSVGGSVGNHSGGGGSTSSSSKRPSKFSSLHHMVADVNDDSEYEDHDGSSAEEDEKARAAGKGAHAVEPPTHRTEGKRKRRKIDRADRANSEDVDQTTPLGRDPISSGYVTEHQARELFGIFMSELNSSLPMLDAAVHSFDFVRAKSPFLLSTTLCVASRFLRGGPDTTPELVTSIPPERARSVHESCLRLARQQMNLAFQHALTTLEIVQAMTLLAIWKEPDDDKAGFYFNRAVVMAKELHLGRIERSRPRSEEEALWRRIRERVWLCLFIVNTIFAMQFNQILQITHEDSLIANSFDWHIGSHSPTDLALIASVQLRARFLHYKSLLEITAADADDLERTDKSHTATLLSLSILTRTSNQDLGNINAHWVEQIREASPTGDIPIKPFIWLAGLRLHLNIVIMNQTIRIENSRQLQRNSLGSIAAFHHSINAACEVLTRMKMLPKRQLAFASDTLLHFTIYAGYFLFTVCTKSTRDLLEPQERQHCEDIVIEASEALGRASLFSADAPALHARFLRRLTSPYLPPQPAPASGTDNEPPQGPDARPRSAHNQAIQHIHHQPDYNNIISTPLNGSVPANGFQIPQEAGNIALAETIWGGTDDGLWMQFDGAWWDHVMQDMTTNNANRPAGINQNFQQ